MTLIGLYCMFVMLLMVGIGSNVGFALVPSRISVSKGTVLLVTSIVLNHHHANFGCCVSGLNIRLRCITLVGFDHPCSELLQYFKLICFL